MDMEHSNNKIADWNLALGMRSSLLMYADIEVL